MTTTPGGGADTSAVDQTMPGFADLFPDDRLYHRSITFPTTECEIPGFPARVGVAIRGLDRGRDRSVLGATDVVWRRSLRTSVDNTAEVFDCAKTAAVAYTEGSCSRQLESRLGATAAS